MGGGLRGCGWGGGVLGGHDSGRFDEQVPYSCQPAQVRVLMHVERLGGVEGAVARLLAARRVQEIAATAAAPLPRTHSNTFKAHTHNQIQIQTSEQQDLNDVIAPSCYACFDYPNALADLVVRYGGGYIG